MWAPSREATEAGVGTELGEWACLGLVWWVQGAPYTAAPSSVPLC